MAKRRTRKEKEEAVHFGTISWNPSSQVQSVKSQNEYNPEPPGLKIKTSKTPDITANISNLASIKMDLVKSLLISLFIIAFELVIYFFWK